MMKKMIVACWTVLFGFCAEAAEINQKWTIDDDEFEMKSVAYDEATVEEFNDLVWSFHKKDAEGITANLRHFDSMKAYEAFAKGVLSQEGSKLKEGKNFLVIIYKNRKLVGGTYYVLENENKIVRMTSAGYNEDLISQMREQIMAKKIIIDILSSRQYFPQSEKLIVFLRNYSSSSAQLKHLGFTESTYSVAEHSPGEHRAFELLIQ